MDAYAKKIEKAKLRAISQRNMTQNELESCSRRQVELNALLKEKQEELERYLFYYLFYIEPMLNFNLLQQLKMNRD